MKTRVPKQSHSNFCHTSTPENRGVYLDRIQ